MSYKATYRRKLARPPSSATEVAIAAAVTAVTTFVVVLSVGSVADVGDAFGFLGGAAGAGLAVLGALWVERKKITDAEVIRRKVIANLLGHFRELLCQMIYREEPADVAALGYHERFNARGRRIDDLSNIANVAIDQLARIDPDDGLTALANLRFRKALSDAKFIVDPQAWRREKRWTTLEMVPQFSEHAEVIGPEILERLDNLIGALGFMDDPKFWNVNFERIPHPPMKN
ncbi:hypothetical protein [Sphingomonas sp. PB4P5]|uniref:hypothetical protein n=1 Tax=Parasphingomonas puruogangriensis TaxID=3096155 RepID=UPI002FC6A336